jgi:hypothetical protein
VIDDWQKCQMLAVSVLYYENKVVCQKPSCAKQKISFAHRFLIDVDCSLVIKQNSKLNGLQTLQ